MVEQYEIIQFSDKMPARLRSMYLEQLDGHWHHGVELIIVLNGEVDVISEGKSYHLKEDDLMVININTVHSLKSANGCNIVSLLMHTERFVKDQTAYFECNSSVDDNKGKYYNLKRLVAELVKANSSASDNNYYYNYSILYNIYFELVQNFAVKRTSQNTDKYFDRLNRIVRYIDEHYRECITLSTLAEHEHLSVPYLSSFIEKYLGVNFQTYYNELRLDRAVHELLNSDRSVEEIAFNNGFSDPRAFTALFKRKYNMLPSVYRKQAKEKGLSREAAQKGVQNTRQEHDSHLLILAKYLPTPDQDVVAPEKYISASKIVNKKNINIQNTKKNLKHNFRVFTSVARAKELLFDEVRSQLAEIQQEIGYEYIKFHGILSDDMLVYEEDAFGNPHYSFMYVDKVLDFLQSINLKPLIEFSFMPKALAKHTTNAVYSSSPFYISPPKDMQKWIDLIAAFTNHIIDRYGLKTVKNWLFTVWNEPDTSTTLFGFENDTDFYELYKATYDTVKGIRRQLVFGSPSLLLPYNINRVWLVNFINWCKDNNCVPDFMNIHFYDNDFSDDSLSQHRPAHPAHSRLNMDEDSFEKCITDAKTMFQDLGIGQLPIYLTEWNLTVSHRNLLNDTCFKSCYLAKNLLENYDDLDSFGYWVLTDFLEELQPSNEQFHGGLGLFTTEGIKKPHYYVFDFINHLGDKLVDKGKGYFITKDYNSIQIILYNYEHFNHLFAAGETFDMTFTKRYTPFSQLGKMDVTLELSGINAKSCMIHERIINQQSGSAFDEWVGMGAPDLDKETIDYLKRISVPKMLIHTDEITDSTLTVHANLEPLEVRLIEIKYSD